jgi:hypothetical protein
VTKNPEDKISKELADEVGEIATGAVDQVTKRERDVG